MNLTLSETPKKVFSRRGPFEVGLADLETETEKKSPILHCMFVHFCFFDNVCNAGFLSPKVVVHWYLAISKESYKEHFIYSPTTFAADLVLSEFSPLYYLFHHDSVENFWRGDLDYVLFW